MPSAPARERQKSCLSIAGVPDGLELLVQGLKEILFKRMLLTLRNAMTTHVFNRAKTRLSKPSSLSMLTDFSLLEELLPAYLPKDNIHFEENWCLVLNTLSPGCVLFTLWPCWFPFGSQQLQGISQGDLYYLS